MRYFRVEGVPPHEKGFNSTTVRALIRHLEATTPLHDALVPDRVMSYLWPLAFWAWRLMLVTSSETVLLFQRK